MPDHLTAIIIKEYQRLTNGLEDFFGIHLKDAMLCKAVLYIQSQQDNQELPINRFNEAYLRAYEELFGV